MNKTSSLRVAVLVSGGVDSAVSLALLKEQGYDVTAFYLKIWLEDELSYLGECPWQEDLSYVERLCTQFDVPLKIISLQKEYWDLVVSYTLSEIKAGRTPNPDIMCNKQIKFGAFLQYIDTTFDYIASGHYAQTKIVEGKPTLWCAPDPIKDQTYFLSYLSVQQLARLIFPIGHLTKQQVRAEAQRLILPNKDRKDSQGICFLGMIKFRDFIKHHMGTRRGDFIEYETGTVLGKHEGYWFYTIGQRQGLGLSGGPWYVVAKDVKQNIITLSRHYYDHDKQRDTFFVQEIQWFSGNMPVDTNLTVKLRHGAHKIECTLERRSDKTYKVVLAERDQGIASGQFAVFYQDQHCLGGGTIV